MSQSNKLDMILLCHQTINKIRIHFCRKKNTKGDRSEEVEFYFNVEENRV